MRWRHEYTIHIYLKNEEMAAKRKTRWKRTENSHTISVLSMHDNDPSSADEKLDSYNFSHCSHNLNRRFFFLSLCFHFNVIHDQDLSTCHID